MANDTPMGDNNEPIDSTNIPVSSINTTSSSSSSVTNNHKDSKKLPQTRENSIDKQSSLIGLILLIFDTIFGSLYKRKKIINH